MLADFCDSVDNEYQIATENNDQMGPLMNENDKLWLTMRHKHISEIWKEIPERLDKFKRGTQAKRVNLDKTKNLTVGELKRAVVVLPRIFLAAVPVYADNFS